MTRYNLNICERPIISLLPCNFFSKSGHWSGDVGGQRTLRPYWRNYFEQTDAIVWVVDSGDRMRMRDCKEELHSLLTEDVSILCLFHATYRLQLLFNWISLSLRQRLAGASLLVLANKQDLQGSMTDAEIRQVRPYPLLQSYTEPPFTFSKLNSIGSWPSVYQIA